MTATEGDRVIVHFINKTPLPHTVHFHGDHPSTQDGVFEQVMANGTYTYDFIATPAGALMYHCHVSPVMQHVRMGLYGAFIVHPKNPLPPAREYVLVSGEYDTQNQLNPFPEYYMFNGYAEGYMTTPLPARTNETVRIYLINYGSFSFIWNAHTWNSVQSISLRHLAKPSFEYTVMGIRLRERSYIGGQMALAR